MSDPVEAEFQIVENRRRAAGMRKREELEAAVRELNRALSGLESDVQPGDDPPPSVFIFGVPRSGTTLCHQLLAQCLDVGYINNLIARFWAAPAHGIALSKHLLEELDEHQRGEYDSRYGKTPGIWGAHEFSYFWHAALNISTVEEVMSFGRADRVDWREARRRVAVITEAFRRPTIFKTLFAGEFAQEFSRWMPSPLFVHVRRSLEDVALSVLQARVDYYGDPAVWWSMYPPGYEELRDLDFAAQIAGQVVGLDAAYRRAVAALDPDQVISVDYAEMAARPQELLEKVVRRLGKLYDVEVAMIRAPPSLVERRRTAVSDEDRAVLAALSVRASSL
jgi:hypothetical protein